MRADFKKVADENTIVIHEYLGEFLEGTWSLAKKISNLTDECLRLVKTGTKYDCITILRNTVSDLLAALDCLERGGVRPILLIIRTAIEDFCSVFRLQVDPKSHSLYLEGKFRSAKAITYTKKRYERAKTFAKVHGMLSPRCHHTDPYLLVRQIASIKNGIIHYDHIKSIDPNKLIYQIVPLKLIAQLLIEISIITEMMCINHIDKFYFIKKSIKGNFEKICLDVPEFNLILKMSELITQIEGGILSN